MSGAPPPIDDTRSSLLTRVRARDPEACAQFVRWIGPFILGWCRRAGFQAADRDELCQQVLLNVWRGLATFRKDRPGDSFRGWVYTITRNCVRDLRARQRVAPGPLPAEPSADSGPPEPHDLERRALQLLLRDLVAAHAGDRGFAAFYRTAVDGLSSADAARELGLTADAVRQHRCRWVKRLRDKLREEFGDLLD